MQEERLTNLLSKTSALMEEFQLNCEAIDKRLKETTQQLNTVAEYLPYQLKQSADSMLGTVPAQIVGQVGQHLNPPVRAFEQRLDQSSHSLQQKTQSIADALQSLQRLHRMLIWKVLGVTLACLIVLLGGGAWLSSYYVGVIRQNQISADLMRVYNNADVAPCGDQLCANVDRAAPRYGDKGQYMRVKAR